MAHMSLGKNSLRGLIEGLCRVLIKELLDCLKGVLTMARMKRQLNCGTCLLAGGSRHSAPRSCLARQQPRPSQQYQRTEGPQEF